MISPFALLTTWTCYGTWLPGDSRGHVSNILLPGGGFDRKHNVVGTPYSEGDSHTRKIAYQEQNFPTVYLSSEQANCVADALVGAASAKGWSILQAAVMANHIHVVTMNCPNDGSLVRKIYKGVTQAALSKMHGSPKRWWTHGGSDRYKYDHTAIETAIHYVANQERMLAGIKDMVAFRL